MKFVCSRCRKLVSSENVIIDVIDVNDIRLAINVYCEDCFEITENNRKLRKLDLEKKYKKILEKGSFIENWRKRIKQLK